MASEEMKNAAVPEEEEPWHSDACSVADIIEGRILNQDEELTEDEKEMYRFPPPARTNSAAESESESKSDSSDLSAAAEMRGTTQQSQTRVRSPSARTNSVSSTLSEQQRQNRVDEKVAKLSTTSSTDSADADASMVSQPAFPTSLDRAQAGLVAAGPGAIAMPGYGDEAAPPPPLPLDAEQSSFLVHAELVPDSADVEQGSNPIVSDSAIVKAEAVKEMDPDEPNFWDLLKLKSVRIALLVLLIFVIALAVGVGVGLSTNSSTTTADPIIIVQDDEDDEDDDDD